MNLQQLAAEHRAAVDKGETSLDFWAWIAATTGAKGASALEIEAALAGVTLAREPEPEDDNAVDPTFDPLAASHPRYGEYLSATAAAGRDTSFHADFWVWLHECRQKGPASSVESAEDDPHGWRDVWAALTAEEREATRQSNKRGADFKPAQAGAASIDEIMKTVNAEAKRA